MYVNFSGLASSYYVLLSNDGPVVLGANITFRAEVFTSGHIHPEGLFRFTWTDNGFPKHNYMVCSY